MPNDLERAFGALTEDTDRAQLLPAAEVRRLAARRTRRGSAAAFATVALLVAGVAVGSRLMVGGGVEQPRPLPPAQSIGVSPPPSSTPAPSRSAPSGATPSSPDSPNSPPVTSKSPPPSIPSAIPARALLNEADSNGGNFTKADPLRPREICPGTGYPSSSRAAVRAAVRMYYKPPGTAPDYSPTDQVTNTVTVYRGDGAADLIDELRAAVRRCPTATAGSYPVRQRSLGSMGLGDESLLIERSTEGFGDNGEPSGNGTRHYMYVAVVRVGDAVTLLDCIGYESVSSDREAVEALTRKAADRLADWRG